MIRPALALMILLALSACGAVDGPEAQGAKALGRVVNVNTPQKLRDAIYNAEDGDTIRIADGEYRLGRLMYMTGKNNITITGASKDAKKVRIQGKSFLKGGNGDDILRIGHCENITVSHVTFEDCGAYALKVQAESNPKNINILHCNFHNAGKRLIKGSGSRGGRAIGGSIRFCHFENSKIPPSTWLFGGDYITAIDMMSLEGWTISDNTFKDIRGRRGYARGAIFVWVRSKNLTIERNLIINCDRGISLGNPSGSSAYNGTYFPHVSDSICRNNVIVPLKDAGIELAWVEGVKVYNNTIWRKEGTGRGIRLIQNIGKVDLRNNLVRGEIIVHQGKPHTANNVVGALDGFFRDPEAADLRLTDAARAAIGAGETLAEVSEDFAGNKRGKKPDIGAYEFAAQ